MTPFISHTIENLSSSLIDTLLDSFLVYLRMFVNNSRIES